MGPPAGGAGRAGAAARFGRLLRVDARGTCTCSDAQTSIAAVRVSPCGGWLVVSSRLVDGGPGALSALRLAPDGSLAPPAEGALGIASTLGAVPRDFVLLGARGGGFVALAANQNTPPGAPHALVALRADGSPPVDLRAAVPSPVAVCVAPRRE